MAEISERTEYDELWKNIIEELIEDFISFFLPDLYKEVDFSKPISFLDKELIKLFPKNEQASGRVDKLVEVVLKSGETDWVLIHIEVQGQKSDEDFSKRMFRYFYKIYDKYDKPITAIAIMTDKIKSYQPKEFSYNCFGTEHSYKYNYYKLLDQVESELEKNDNPFALVVLAALLTIKSLEDEEVKYNFKVRLIRLLFEKGYDKKKIRHIFLFIDNILKLKEDKNEKFLEEIEILSGENKMAKDLLMGNLGEIFYNKGKIEGEISLLDELLKEGTITIEKYNEKAEPLKKLLEQDKKNN